MTTRAEVPEIEEELSSTKRTFRVPSEKEVSRVAGPTDHVILVLELVSAPKSGKRGAPKPSHVTLDVFAKVQPAFPGLLGPADDLSMSTESLLQEIELVLDIPGSGPGEETGIYSIRVVSPHDFRLLEVPSELSLGRQAEIRNGYLHHSVLYSPSPIRRIMLLRLLEGADAVELKIRSGGGEPRRKKIHVVHEREPSTVA